MIVSQNVVYHIAPKVYEIGSRNLGILISMCSFVTRVSLVFLFSNGRFIAHDLLKIGNFNWCSAQIQNSL